MNELIEGNAKEFLIKHAKCYENPRVLELLESGASSPEDAEILAKFYWFVVDTTLNENVEYLLEKSYTALHIHCNNQGYGGVWDSEIP